LTFVRANPEALGSSDFAPEFQQGEGVSPLNECAPVERFNLLSLQPAEMHGKTPVIIVGFRNHEDVTDCVAALIELNVISPIEIFVCENGGGSAFARLVDALTASRGSCERAEDDSTFPSAPFVTAATLRVKGTHSASDILVHVGGAKDNLGYAGGVNAWLRPLLQIPGWDGAWILNPDTEPDPRALAELIDYAKRQGRCMVGSRLTSPARPGIVHSRGLAWSKWRASTHSVDRDAAVEKVPSPDEVDSRIDSPSGASLYVTRHCLEQIGLMDERYFLYCEDLDWGIRAKRVGSIGYVHASVVPHKGGTTIGSSTVKRQQSPLSVYLEFRNRLIFVRAHFAMWLPWTILMSAAYVVRYLCLGSFQNAVASARGLCAGLLGSTGRPDNILRTHLQRVGRIST
jgi:N-acetylglucosaminyl-diphospho-decaprenol L-rhamnosyltransferase